MAQWVNHFRNNIFINPPPLHVPLLCEISKALHLVQPDLTAGRLAGWQAAGWQAAGWQADEIQVNFENFRICYRLTYYRYFALFSKCTASL